MEVLYRKIFLVFIILISMVLLRSVACKREPVNVKWSDSEFTAAEVIKDSTAYYLVSNLPLDDTVVVAKGKLGLLLVLYAKTVVYHSSPKFFNEAYAFSYTTHYILHNKVDSIRIITLRDFDAQYLAGSVVNDILEVYNNEKFMDIATVIRDDPYLNYDEIDDRRRGPSFGFNLRLKKQPSADTLVQFKSIVYFSNRKTSVDTCQLVIIGK